MMRYGEKKRALAAAAVVLAVAIACGLALSPESRHARASRGRLLEGDSEEIASLEIQTAGGVLRFRRFGGAWTLEEGGAAPLPVRVERVEDFLSAVGAVRTMVEAAKSEESWPALGLDAASARRVRLLRSDGSAAADFRVGRYSPEGSRVYLRKEGDARSWTAASAVASRLPSARGSWLDLRVFGESVPLEDVQRLRVSGSLRLPEGGIFRADYSVTRSLSKGWVSDEIRNLDPAAAGRLVRSWMNAEAGDFVSDGPAPGDRGNLRVDLELGGGALRSLWISGTRDAEGGYRATLTGSNRHVRIAAWTIVDLLEEPADLAYKPMP